MATSRGRKHEFPLRIQVGLGSDPPRPQTSSESLFLALTCPALTSVGRKERPTVGAPSKDGRGPETGRTDEALWQVAVPGSSPLFDLEANFSHRSDGHGEGEQRTLRRSAELWGSMGHRSSCPTNGGEEGHLNFEFIFLENSPLFLFFFAYSFATLWGFSEV